ncbi:MAG: hypothetical protein O2875_05845 [Planctomycetota bacterium]|nr:hypothetical protein [Planctomycetota bacterium]
MSQSLISKLAHRKPFLFVDSIISISENEVQASWAINHGDAILEGHFPGDPIVPGVLLIESLAQTSGLVLLARDPVHIHKGMLVHSDIRFRHPIKPPAIVLLTAKDDGSLGSINRFLVTAHVGNVLVADGTIALSIKKLAV